MSRWWRAYESALDDPKVQRLPDVLFRTWFNLLCLTSRHDGVLPALDDCAFALRLPGKEMAKRLDLIIESGLIDRCGNGTLTPHNWNDRQFQSDVSTTRVQRFRERRREPRRNVSETAAETPPDTDTDTDSMVTTVSDETSVTIVAEASATASDERQKRIGLFQSVVGLWNELASELRLPEVRDITARRQSAIVQRSRDLVATYDFSEAMEGWRDLMRRIRESPFLRGEAGTGFRADFDFAIRSTSFTKIMEGKYAPEKRPVSFLAEPKRVWGR